MLLVSLDILCHFQALLKALIVAPSVFLCNRVHDYRDRVVLDDWPELLNTPIPFELISVKQTK